MVSIVSFKFIGRQVPLAVLALLTLLAPLVLPAQAAGAASLVIEDDDHYRLELAGPVRRIVSLAPGATAMLFAAGAGALVVGTSEYSDEPAAASRVPRIGDSHAVNLERLLALRPDVVVVWSGGTAPSQIERLENHGLRVYRHRLARLDEIAPSLERLGLLAGTVVEARRAATSVTTRLEALRSRYRGGAVRTILLQVWDRPLYTVGGAELLSDVVATCGYRNLYADLPDPGPAVAVESVLARNPDVILALAGDPASAAAWAQRWQEFPVLAAVRSRHVLAWSDLRLSRLGPAMLDATEALCAALPH
jgi:iron complex transport system substrate-binding protein